MTINIIKMLIKKRLYNSMIRVYNKYMDNDIALILSFYVVYIVSVHKISRCIEE